MSRDYMVEVALVAHLYPSMGDPRTMPVAAFDRLVATIPDVLEMTR